MERVEHWKLGWRERKRAIAREKAERMGDTPERAAEREREGREPDVKDAASGAAIAGTVSAPGGAGGGGM